MKRLYLIIGLVLIANLCFAARIQQYHMMIIGQEQAAAGCSSSISDDFSGTLGNWNQLEGTWSISSETLPTPGTTGVIIYSNEQTCTVKQWVLVEFDDVAGVGDQTFCGIYIRSDNGSASYAYAVRYEKATPNQFAWRYCTESGTPSSCTTIQTAEHTLIDGDYVGIEIEGTGDSTIVRIWDLGGSPPANIDGDTHGSWGAADYTFTDNPAQVADSGKYVGLYAGHTYITVFDNFSAGHFD